MAHPDCERPPTCSACRCSKWPRGPAPGATGSRSLGVAGHHREGMVFEQFSNVTQACLAGLGVALMPEFLIEPELGERPAGARLRLGGRERERLLSRPPAPQARFPASPQLRTTGWRTRWRSSSRTIDGTIPAYPRLLCCNIIRGLRWTPRCRNFPSTPASQRRSVRLWSTAASISRSSPPMRNALSSACSIPSGTIEIQRLTLPENTHEIFHGFVPA